MSQEQWFSRARKFEGNAADAESAAFRNPAALKKRDFDRDDDELALIHRDCGDQRGAAPQRPRKSRRKGRKGRGRSTAARREEQ